MKKALFRTQLLVKKSPIHGYGVFAEHDIKPGSLIEECYVLPVDNKDHTFMNYSFMSSEKGSLLALGYGSIYNHAEKPNAYVDFDLAHFLLIIKAKCFIKKGEEIFITYGDGWFASRELVCKYSLRYQLQKYKKLLRTIGRFLLAAGFLLSCLSLFKTFFE